MNSQPHIIHLDALTFDNRFVRELPADPETANHRHQVIGACYSRVLPTKVARPQIVAYPKEVAKQFGLAPEVYESEYFPQVFVGSRLLVGMDSCETEHPTTPRQVEMVLANSLINLVRQKSHNLEYQ